MKRPTLKQAAQAATAIAFMVLIASQWALFDGPLAGLTEYGHTLAVPGHAPEFFGFILVKIVIEAAVMLVFGGIGICIVAAYLAFERMQQRQALPAVIENGE